jgi:replicative DNA helicase
MSRTFSLDTEHALLSAIITHPETFDRVADVVTERDFVNVGNRAIFVAVSALVMASKAVDVLTVHQKLGELGTHDLSVTDINAIAQSLGSPRAARRYAEILRIASIERNLSAAIEEAAAIAEGDGELNGRLEQITALFSGMAHKTVRKMPRLISDLLINRIDYYTALSMGEIPSAWRTRIPTLDRLLSGGLRGGKVYVVAARPKVGKTSLCAQIATTFAKDDGLPSLILTQEMPDTEVTDRAISNVGRVPYSNLMTGKLTNDDWGCMTEGVETLSRVPIWIDDQGGLTLNDIRSKARAVKGLKLLVIDYLQLCSGSTGRAGANRNEEIGEISRGIKTLAKELDCAVLLLSQLNRDVESRPDKEPRLSDLRESGSIEQDADAVIFLWPVRDFDTFGHKLIACGVAANRSGSTGKFGLDFQGRYQLWNESSEDIKPIAAASRGKRHFEAD